LADANIFINLDRFRLFSFLEELSNHYNWEIFITPAVKRECKNRFTSSRINALLRKKTIKLLLESGRDVLNCILKLEKYMDAGAEIELFAIAECRNYSVLTHDIQNTNVYQINFGRGNFWTYDLYKLFYLGYKVNILSSKEAEKALFSLPGSKKIMRSGFLKFVDALDNYAEKHFDPHDIERIDP
jgi:hypothetical protein